MLSLALKGEHMNGLALKDSGIRSEHQVMIVAITSREGEMVFNPSADQILRAGDLLIAIGTGAGLTRLAEIAGYQRGKTAKLS